MQRLKTAERGYGGKWQRERLSFLAQLSWDQDE